MKRFTFALSRAALCCATMELLMAQTPNYTAQKAAVDGVDVVKLTDAAHHMEVSIAPSVGNIAYDMRVNGKPVLLAPPGSLADWKAKPSQAGIPLLAPWANRLNTDSYWANGKQHMLDLKAGNIGRDGFGQPIHGLLLYASDWQVVSVKADQHAAEVTSRLDFSKRPEWLAQFPFAHTIEITHRLSDGVLQVTTSIANHAKEPMPLVIGFHPWYQIPDVPRDEWKLHLPVKEHYVLSNKLIPTGETKPYDLGDPYPLKGHQLDDVFGGVNPSDEFRLEARGMQISVRYGAKYPVAVVFAPPTRPVVCFEPMTGITNGFNLAHAGVFKGLQSIPAGGKWSESFWVRPSGF